MILNAFVEDGSLVIDGQEIHIPALEGIDGEVVITIEKKTEKRTSQQNRALHKDCQIIADKLNEAGKDMRIVLKPTYLIPWTKESVKDHLFRPVMEAMFSIESTRDLEKGKQIDSVHDVIMRELGEKHGIEYHPFPSK